MPTIIDLGNDGDFVGLQPLVQDIEPVKEPAMDNDVYIPQATNDRRPARINKLKMAKPLSTCNDDVAHMVYGIAITLGTHVTQNKNLVSKAMSSHALAETYSILCKLKWRHQ